MTPAAALCILRFATIPAVPLACPKIGICHAANRDAAWPVEARCLTPEELRVAMGREEFP